MAESTRAFVRTPSTYETWIAEQGLPVTEGYGVTDVTGLARARCERTGGSVGYVKLTGMAGLTGMYVVELAPGEQLVPERHLYEKILYVLGGDVDLELRGSRGNQVAGLPRGTLGGVPLNVSHVLRNRSEHDAATVLCFTNAPMIMDLFHSANFVLGCDYDFRDRYDDEGDYFERMERYIHAPEGESVWIWATNRVLDVPGTEVDVEEKKGTGMRLSQAELADGVLVTHIADWPVGSYQKAHYHGAGAILLIVRGQGYTLMWPKEAGPRPYAAGHDDVVVRVDWREGSIFCPPDGWFHQHFNTGPVAARQLAFRYGSRRYGVEFYDLRKGRGAYASLELGGTMIEYGDEDPRIATMFVEECGAQGVEVLDWVRALADAGAARGGVGGAR